MLGFFYISKKIYNLLSDTNKKIIDQSDITYHKQKMYTFFSDRKFADELLIYSVCLVRNNELNESLELFDLLLPFATWYGHFYIQIISDLLYKYREDKNLRDKILSYVLLDYNRRKLYLPNLNNARFTSWEIAIKLLINEKNYFMAKTICLNAIALKKVKNIDWYENKLKSINNFIKKENTSEIKVNESWDKDIIKNNNFVLLYKTLKKELIKDFLF